MEPVLCRPLPTISHGRGHGAAARALLIVHLEESRICVDVLRPQQLDHRLHFMGAIVVAMWKPVSELALIHDAGVRGARMRCVCRPGRSVGNAFGRNRELISLYRCRHFGGSVWGEREDCFLQENPRAKFGIKS